jgi:hypothetical protein
VGLGPAARDAAALGDVLSAFEGREALPEGQLASNRSHAVPSGLLLLLRVCVQQQRAMLGVEGKFATTV